MIGKFYNINSQTLASGAIIPLATSRVCGCGIRLEGNEIIISEPGTYLVNVSVTASQTSTTAQGVRLLVSTPSGVTVQSEGGSASSSDATAGNVRTLAFSDTVRVLLLWQDKAVPSHYRRHDHRQCDHHSRKDMRWLDHTTLNGPFLKCTQRSYS